jgi:pyruvate/2-oxoglutarate dehydrogenase complex dihydrolipoamide acyltransferase (E2) component
MPFVLPSLGDSVESAVITRWLKTVGDQVEADEPLLEVATDKVDTEITAPHDGIITELLADEDSVVAVGALAVIDPADPPDAEATSATPSPDPPATNNTDPVSDDSLDDRGQDPGNDAATPTSTPEEDKPTTPTVAPVEPASTPAPNINGDRTEKMTRLRRTIATRMVESLRVSAQLTTVVEADITALAHFRNQVKDRFFTDTGLSGAARAGLYQHERIRGGDHGHRLEPVLGMGGGRDDLDTAGHAHLGARTCDRKVARPGDAEATATNAQHSRPAAGRRIRVGDLQSRRLDRSQRQRARL